MTLFRRLRAFASDLRLIPTMWRYLVAVAQQDRATERAIKHYRNCVPELSARIDRTVLGFASLSQEIRRP